jgi:hypothetical protein
MAAVKEVVDEDRTFQIRWTEYHFLSVLMVLLSESSENIPVLKEYIIKSHYFTKHASK